MAQQVLVCPLLFVIALTCLLIEFRLITGWWLASWPNEDEEEELKLL